MPNITIYLPEAVARSVRRAARTENLTVSRWVAARIASHLKKGPAPGIINAAGAIPEFPSVGEIRAGYAQDAERENLA